MKKMQSVMTVRLPKEDLKIVEEISSKEKMDKSTTVRELIELGKIYFAINKYNEEKIDAMLNELNVQDIIADEEKGKKAS